MSAVEWNLESLDIASVRVVQVHYSSSVAGDPQFASDRRLLVLSHAIAYTGIPAFFLKQSPKYLRYQNTGPVVVVFDLNDKFSGFTLSEIWETEAEILDMASGFCAEFYDELQRAVCVTSYYEFKQLNPLYFTSFLVVPGSHSKSEPFLYEKVPLRRNKMLCMRTMTKGSLDFVVESRNPVPVGSFVLVPPYEHPFYVLSYSPQAQTLSLLSVEKERMTIELGSTQFVLITRPPVQMASFYKTEQDSRETAPRGDCQFKAKELFDFTQEDIESFIAARFANDDEAHEEGKRGALESFLDYPELSVEQVVSQIVSDPAARGPIIECLGKLGTLPSHRFELHIRAASFLSFFRFEFGFSDVKPPYHAQSLVHGSSCIYERLGIPQVLVGCDGKITEVSASSVVDEWVEKFYQPISGPKSGHYIVVCSPEVPIEHAKLFFRQLSDIYRLHEFGKLTPFPRFDAHYSIPVDEMGSFIMRLFYEDQSLSEFQQFPLLTFIVGPPIYDPSFRPCSILSYVRPESIGTASRKEIAAFAFVVYSRIRNFSPTPFGMISLAPVSLGEAATFFFGYRYQPPFLLPRSDNRNVTMHVAWDHVQNMSTWMDDIGSVLQFLPESPLDRLVQTMRSCIDMLPGVTVRFTVSVLAEGISRRLLHHIESALGPLLSSTTIFAVSPEPTVQVLFKEEFQDDAVIFSAAQQFRASSDDEFEPPLATCYVVAHTLPAYGVSLYTKPATGTPEDTVRAYAKHMSHMSWLSVKPGSENRTISYPPHVCALIRKNTPSTTILSRYEFLPSTEII